MRLTLRSAARVLFSSLDYGRASHIRPLLRGRADQVGELPNGVDTSVFTPGEPPAALRAQYRPDDMIAWCCSSPVWTGRTTSRGGGAARRPGGIAGQRARRVIVGDGDLRPTYEATARRLGLGERVSFAGRVSDEALPDYYRLADVTVLPSVTMGEAFGLVLVESLACATPVIATTICRACGRWWTMARQWPAGRAGRCNCARYGAIERIVGDEERCARWGAAGRAKAHRCRLGGDWRPTRSDLFG
ncbi:MAG: glycosyltransferase [Thermomicrobiales bacterium]